MLNAATLREITDLLAPHVAGENERRALLTAAFGADHRLISQIDLSGAARPFAINLITRVNNYGEVVPGQPALVALLEALKLYVGDDQIKQIDQVIGTLGGKPTSPVISTSTTSTPTTSTPATSTPTPPNNGQIRILFMAANPRNTDPLRLGEEIRLIDERLRLASLRDQFDLQQAHAVRVSDIQEHLLRYKPQIIHFSGHGMDDGALIFEDAAGKLKPVTPEALADLFRILKQRICCVVLNACYSNVQADVIAGQVDFVIGMKQAILDRTAIEFTGSFYRALGYGEAIATAFDLGRNAVMLAGLGQADLLALHMREGVDPQKLCK